MTRSNPPSNSAHARTGAKIFLLAGLFLFLSACGNEEPTTSNDDPQRAGAEGTATDAARPTREETLLIKRMRSASVPEVQEYIKEVLALPLPDDYQIPGYLLETKDYREASEAIGDHYPEFYGKQGRALIEAVKEQPVRYRELVLETRAARKLHGQQ